MIADHMELNGFAVVAQGTQDYPDRSTTLILQVEDFADHGFMLEGPGIKGRIGVSFSAMEFLKGPNLQQLAAMAETRLWST